MTVAGRVAIVTAAGQGIGRAVAIELARAGTRLVINDLSAEHGDAVTVELRALGAEVDLIVGDVATAETARALARRAAERFGQLDILVSNAGYQERVSFLDMTIEQLERTLRVCVTGTTLVTQAAARVMIEQGRGGAIVMMGSIMAEKAVPTLSAYSAAKAALHQLAATAALELAGDGIRVNVVAPGWIDTPGERRFATAAQMRVAGGMLPSGRIGRPEDVAKVVAFLVSEEAGYMTGAIVRVDGGLTLSGSRWRPDSTSRS